MSSAPFLFLAQQAAAHRARQQQAPRPGVDYNPAGSGYDSESPFSRLSILGSTLANPVRSGILAAQEYADPNSGFGRFGREVLSTPRRIWEWGTQSPEYRSAAQPELPVQGAGGQPAPQPEPPPQPQPPPTPGSGYRPTPETGFMLGAQPAGTPGRAPIRYGIGSGPLQDYTPGGSVQRLPGVSQGRLEGFGRSFNVNPEGGSFIAGGGFEDLGPGQRASLPSYQSAIAAALAEADVEKAQRQAQDPYGVRADIARMDAEYGHRQGLAGVESDLRLGREFATRDRQAEIVTEAMAKRDELLEAYRASGIENPEADPNYQRQIDTIRGRLAAIGIDLKEFPL